MSGQVSSVAAKLGQQVTVGQTLAQLNTTSLNNALKLGPVGRGDGTGEAGQRPDQ